MKRAPRASLLQSLALLLGLWAALPARAKKENVPPYWLD